MAGNMYSSVSSLQELFAELANDKCTFDNPTFISIYFYSVLDGAYDYHIDNND